MSEQLSLLNEESGELTKLTPEHQFWQQQVTRLSTWEITANDTVASYKQAKVPVISENASEDEIQRALSSIPALEKEVKVLTRLAKDMKDSRLEITRTFEDTKKRMMSPEKTYDEYLEKLKSGLLNLKLKEEEILEKRRKRVKDLEDFRIKTQEQFNKLEELLKSRIREGVDLLYKTSLDEKSESAIRKAISTSLVDDFSLEFPFPKEASGDKDGFIAGNDKEKADIYNSIISIFDQKYYFELLSRSLNAKLESFEEDLKNIELTKLRIAQEKLEAEKKAKEDLEFKNEMAKYTGHGTVLNVPQLVSKKLQSTLVIDMAGTDSDIYVILQVFLKDVPNFMRHYKGRKRIEVVDKIIALIEAEKNLTENSQIFDGLDFVEVKSL
jgi:hypothetical protein